MEQKPLISSQPTPATPPPPPVLPKDPMDQIEEQAKAQTHPRPILSPASNPVTTNETPSEVSPQPPLPPSQPVPTEPVPEQIQPPLEPVTASTEITAPSQKDPNGKKMMTIVIGLFALFVIGAGGLLLFSLLNKPTQSNIQAQTSAPLPTVPVQNPTAVPTPTPLSEVGMVDQITIIDPAADLQKLDEATSMLNN